MDGIDAEMIEQVAIVLEISSEGDAGTRIEIGSRLAEPAPIHPYDSIEAGKIRDPRRPEEGRARVAVLKQDCGRVFPGVGVVRDVVIEPRLAGAGEVGHRAMLLLLKYRLAPNNGGYTTRMQRFSLGTNLKLQGSREAWN